MPRPHAERRRTHRIADEPLIHPPATGLNPRPQKSIRRPAHMQPPLGSHIQKLPALFPSHS